MFNLTKEEYETALKNSDHSTSLKYTARPTKKKRNRKRIIIWSNAPYSRNVSTNIGFGKKFLHLVDKHFPCSNKLHKIFNRNTIKVSYSCTDNMAKIIKIHNKKVTSKVAPTSPKCNCRKRTHAHSAETAKQPALFTKPKSRQQQTLKNIYRAYKRDVETKKLHTQIIIQQPKIHQQHYIIKAYMEIT